MRVICLEGCHGCGKTSICQEVSKQTGVPVLDEAFLDMPEYALHPQSLTMESAWVSFWFQRILRYAHENQDLDIVIADRSPWSAAVYAPAGSILEPLIKKQIEELREKNISIECVYLDVAPAVLWERLLARVEADPERKKYREDDKGHMFATLRWYNARFWDHRHPNNEEAPEKVAKSLVESMDLSP